jgi:hypothetical protein
VIDASRTTRKTADHRGWQLSRHIAALIVAIFIVLDKTRAGPALPVGNRAEQAPLRVRF